MANTLGSDIKNDVEQTTAQFYMRYSNRRSYLIGTAKGYLTDMERAALSYKPDSRVEQILQGGNITRKQLFIAQLLDKIEQNIRTDTEDLPLLPDEMKQAQREDVTKWLARLFPVLYNKLDRIFISGVGSYEASKQINELIDDNLPGLYGILDFHEAKADTYLAARGKDPFGMGRYRFQNGDGENICTTCNANDGQTYTLNELTTLGLIPPLHKNCRCKIVVVSRESIPRSVAGDTGIIPPEEMKIGEPRTFGGGERAAKAEDEWYDPFLRMPEDIKVLWDGFVESSNERFNEMLKNPSLITILDWITYGALSASGQRGEKILEDPSFYNIGNWLTSGIFDMVKGTFDPDEPLSLEHWLNSFGTAGLLMSLYELYQQRVYMNSPEYEIERAHIENAGKGAGDIADDALDDVVEGKGNAIVDSRKFDEYIFKDGAKHGKDVIYENLGYGKQDSSLLSNIYQEQGAAKYAAKNYTLGELDSFGQRINIEIELKGIGNATGKTSYINSGWIINPDGSIRLVTPMAGFTR